LASVSALAMGSASTAAANSETFRAESLVMRVLLVLG
jgi:hypothetical protein